MSPLAHLRDAALGRLRRRGRHAPGRDDHVPVRPDPATRGLIRRSFFLRALYHGLQHRFGRLDYGRLVGFGLTEHRPDSGRRARTDRLREFRRVRPPRLYEGVVEHFNALRSAGRRSSWSRRRRGIVIEPLCDLSRLPRHAHDPRVRSSAGDRPESVRPALLRRGKALLGQAVGRRAADRDGRCGGVRG